MTFDRTAFLSHNTRIIWQFDRLAILLLEEVVLYE
jgi:hypothetical protein